MANQEKFEQWLKKFIQNETTIKNYSLDLKETIPNELSKKDENIDNLFNIYDITYLEQLYERMRENGDLRQFSKNIGNQRPSAALRNYINFLKNENHLKENKVNEKADLSSLTKDDILKAIQKYEELKEKNQLNPLRESIKYKLVYNSKVYSAKYIVGIAYALKYPDDKRIDGHVLNHEYYHSEKARKILENLGFEIIEKNNAKKENNIINIDNYSYNQILYGPPGTGKTYKTIELALEIIAQKNEKLKNFLQNDYSREKLKEKFDEYKEKRQIEFITFHQSYSYEEFIEGIKAETDENGNIRYKIKDGIFKELAIRAKSYIFNLDNIINFIKNNNFYFNTSKGKIRKVYKNFC